MHPALHIQLHAPSRTKRERFKSFRGFLYKE
jgi:hypothetical protein